VRLDLLSHRTGDLDRHQPAVGGRSQGAGGSLAAIGHGDGIDLGVGKNAPDPDADGLGHLFGGQALFEAARRDEDSPK